MCDAIYFDLDGTLADLYSIDNWEYKLNHDDATPYQEAAPLVDMNKLQTLCAELANAGVVIGIISWLAKNSNKAYDAKVRQAKKEWLVKHFPCATELHFVKYGTTKLKAAKYKNSILVDDNAAIRNGWNGHSTIDANKNILKELQKVLDTLPKAC